MRLRLNHSVDHVVRTLDSLPAGDGARLVAIGGERSFRRRLLELGFLPGTAVRVVRRVDVGHLIEVELGGGLLSLRCAEAAVIQVTDSER